MEKNFTDFGNKEIVKEKKIPSKLEVAPLYAKCGLDWMGEWIPLRLLRLLEHLAVLKIPSKLEVAPLYAKCGLDLSGVDTP